MAAGITDLFTQATNGTRPVPTTLTSSRAISAATISCGALTGWPTGTAVHFIIYTVNTSGEKVAGSQTDWKGIVSGTTITNCTLKAGSDSGDSIGAIVECGPSAAWANDIVAGMVQDHGQLGYHKDLTDANGNEWIKQTATASAVNELTIANAATGSSPTISATGGDSNIDITLTPKGTGGVNITGRSDGWVSGLTAPNTVTALGNRSYDLVFNSTDLTDTVSPGMRLKMTRTITAPTQCTDLESGSSQYFSKSSPAGMTFTDDFVVSAWIKLESYPTGEYNIASRFNGTSGWYMDINSAGAVRLVGVNGGSSNVSLVLSYAAVPLGKWVHVAAQLDMSAFTATTTTSYVMFDGIDVLSNVVRSGTNPTALIQAGDFQIGADNSLEFFDGKIAQVAVYSAKVTQATVLASMHQGLTGSETSLAAGYSLSNSLLDLTANDNDLTASGGALATDTDSPFAGRDFTGLTAGTTEMGIVTKTAFSTNTTLTVQVPEGYAIPTSGGVSAVSYSTHRVPYGFPAAKNRFTIESLYFGQTSQASAVDGTWYNVGGQKLIIPSGRWKAGYQVSPLMTATTYNLHSVTLSTGASTESNSRFSSLTYFQSGGATTTGAPRYKDGEVVTTTNTTYYLNHRQGSGTSVTLFHGNGTNMQVVFAECEYV